MSRLQGAVEGHVTAAVIQRDASARHAKSCKRAGAAPVPLLRARGKNKSA